MDILHAFIMALIEGITEFLPISSTGHMILASKLLSIQSTDFVKTFEIVIQSGSILAVLILYIKELVIDRDLLKKIIVAFIPTGIFGLILYKIVKTFLLGNSNITLIMLFLGGIAIIWIELHFKKGKNSLTIKNLSYKKAFIIGIIQSLSMIPGVSRAAATIFGGMFMGLDRKSAVEFSFMLAIPTMLAATGLDLVKSAPSFTGSQAEILLFGFVVAFVSALIVVKWLISYAKRFDFIPFGIYRIIVSLAFFLFIIR